jgi:hypothetical protein
MKDFINGRNAWIAELGVDVNKGKPAMSVKVSRKAGGMGISAGQVGTSCDVPLRESRNL